MKKAIIIIIAFLVLFFVGILIIYNNLPLGEGFEEVSIEDGSILLFDISKMYPEKVDIDLSFFQNFDKRGVAFNRLIKVIEAAKDDNEIKGMLITGSGLSMNRGQADELLEALAAFGENKTIYGYSEILTMGSSLIFAHADSFFVPPAGMMLVNGIAIEPFFYKGLFDKLGIGMDVVMLGDYKGGMENFTRKSFSEPFAESIDMLLDDVYDFYRTRISEARNITPADFDSIVAKGLLWSDDMVATGLVDGLLYKNQVDSLIVERLKAATGDDIDMDNLKDRIISVNKYARHLDENGDGFKTGKIALVIAEGAIKSGKGNSSPFAKSEGIYSDALSETIDKIARDDDIDAIVLRVNSPGGSALASDIIWNSIVKAKAKKPFVVSQSGVAASGGYYISMPADTIFAGEGTVTGSIGVYAGRPYIDGLLDELDVTSQTFQRGKYAQIYGTITRPWNDEERGLLLRSIDHTYATFTGKAAEGRHMSIESLDSVAQGHIWTGKRALENGLVDKIGGLWDAVECAQRMAGLDPSDTPEVVTYPKPKGFMDLIEDLENISLPGPLAAIQGIFQKDTDMGMGFGEPLLICPFDVKTDEHSAF